LKEKVTFGRFPFFSEGDGQRAYTIIPARQKWGIIVKTGPRFTVLVTKSVGGTLGPKTKQGGESQCSVGGGEKRTGSIPRRVSDMRIVKGVRRPTPNDSGQRQQVGEKNCKVALLERVVWSGTNDQCPRCRSKENLLEMDEKKRKMPYGTLAPTRARLTVWTGKA